MLGGCQADRNALAAKARNHHQNHRRGHPLDHFTLNEAPLCPDLNACDREEDNRYFVRCKTCPSGWQGMWQRPTSATGQGHGEGDGRDWECLKFNDVSEKPIAIEEDPAGVSGVVISQSGPAGNVALR